MPRVAPHRPRPRHQKLESHSPCSCQSPAHSISFPKDQLIAAVATLRLTVGLSEAVASCVAGVSYLFDVTLPWLIRLLRTDVCVCGCLRQRHGQSGSSREARTARGRRKAKRKCRYYGESRAPTFGRRQLKISIPASPPMTVQGLNRSKHTTSRCLTAQARTVPAFCCRLGCLRPRCCLWE